MCKGLGVVQRTILTMLDSTPRSTIEIAAMVYGNTLLESVDNAAKALVTLRDIGLVIDIGRRNMRRCPRWKKANVRSTAKKKEVQAWRALEAQHKE